MTKSKLLILIACCIWSLLNIGCTEQNSSGSIGKIGSMKSIHILKPANDSNVNISSFVKNVKIIPLEFNKHCILGKIVKITITGDGIYIKDEQNKAGIFKFDNKGKFISIIGKQGKGPGEHIELTDFSLNKSTNSLYIFDNAQKKIIEYSLDNKFIKDIPVGFGSLNFIYKENLFYYYEMSRSLDENYDLIIKDMKGKTVSSYFKSFPGNICIGQNVFLDQPDGLLATFAHNDTIYTLKKNKLEYAYYIDYGKHKVSASDQKALLNWNTNADKLFREKKYIGGIYDLFRVKNMMFFTYGYMNTVYNALYNIKTGQTITSNSFSDDISGLYFSDPISQTVESFIGVYEPTNISNNIDHIKDLLKQKYITNTDKTKSMIARLESYKKQGTDNMNPFILIYELK